MAELSAEGWWRSLDEELDEADEAEERSRRSELEARWPR